MSAQIIESWIDQYSDELLHWAEYRTGDSALAQDMVQETFIAAFENYHQFKGDSNPKTWLSRILRNKIVDYFRSAYYRKNIFVGCQKCLLSGWSQAVVDRRPADILAQGSRKP